MNDLIKGRKHLSRIFVGAAIAVPFLLIIGLLFISADPFIQKTLNEFLSIKNIPQLMVRIVWDLFAFVFFISAGATLVSRLVESRHPVHQQTSTLNLDHVVASTFLILLNLLFAIFIAFQIAYFFGGEAFIQAQGIAYADYARGGFFQLLWVAIIVTGVMAGIYRFTGMKHWLIRGFTILLALQTGVVITSALRRMLLYIEAYGLSVQRFWATYVIYIIAAILLISVIAIVGNMAFAKLIKALSISLLLLAATSLFINAEGIVADHNVNRFLSGQTDHIDVFYLTTLSSDAIPALTRLANARPDMTVIDNSLLRMQEHYKQLAENPTVAEYVRTDAQTQLTQITSDINASKTLTRYLRDREATLRSRQSDWRNLVFSDYQALAAVGSLK